MEIGISIGLSVISFFCGLNTQRCKKTNKFLPGFSLLILIAGQAFILKHYKSSKKKKIVFGTCLAVSNLFGRSFQMVGLTGTKKSGKTMALSYIRETYHSIGIIDCDEIGREILRPGKAAHRQIVKEFGDSILEINGKINTKELRDLILADNDYKKKLNSIVHPRILWEVLKKVILFKLKGYSVVMVQAPLLFETKILTYLCCPIISIYVKDDELLIRRIKEKFFLTDSEAYKMICHQMHVDEKIRLSDHAIDNSGSIYQLENALRDAIRIHLGIIK